LEKLFQGIDYFNYEIECKEFKVAFMENKRILKQRRRDDRRKLPDRRNGYDRRRESNPDPVDDCAIFNTQEACNYLKISRPTYLKYITSSKIRAIKIGRGWKVIKSELDRFIRGDQRSAPESET
jgi:excisionase family DNA binding protein